MNTEPFEEKYKLTDILERGDSSVKFTDLENFFNVYRDKNDYFRYNVNSTIYLDVPSSRLKTYVCQHDMHWPTISYAIYNTVRLSWVLMKINGITPEISFDVVPAGSKVKYLEMSDVTTILDGFTD